MKKLLVIIALALPTIMSAQKFGYVNTSELFQQMPEVAKVKAQMDTIQTQYENQLMLMQEELKKKAEDYNAQMATLPEGVKQVREQELQDMQSRIQSFYQTAEQEIQKKQQELVAPIHEKMSKAIKVVGEKEGYTYIFDSVAMVYVSQDANDVMPSVKKELGIK